MIVHAEDPSEVGEPSGPSYDAFVASRPPVAERRAIETVISAAAGTGARAHIVHLAAGECAALIGAAQAAGVEVSAETCPHYLYFAAEEVPAGHTEFKCCPPVRYAPNREALWRALEAGVIGGVVSDHSPCTLELKRFDEGDFRTAWGGIASLQVALPAVWTVARGEGAPCRTSPAGCRRSRLPWRAWMTARARSPSGGTRTLSRSTRTRPSRCARPTCCTRTRSRRMTGGRWPASCGEPGCAGSR